MSVKRFCIIFSTILLALISCILSSMAIFFYASPMEDASYNLSLLPEDGQEWEGSKGWSVYTVESGQTTMLISDEHGGYSGLSYPGQTFYFSRKLDEKLDSPTLRIGAANRTVSVFLDHTLIYTDCPELTDNRIGSLKLPMLDYDRSDPVIVSLPLDYLNHTLTIAQSSPEFSEKQGDSDTVYPCDVTLYCGYSYESSLISSSVQTMIPAVLLFALQLILLAAFLWNATLGKFLPALPVFACTIQLQMIGVLIHAPFFHQYLGTFSFDLHSLVQYVSAGMLLVFLALYAGRLRPVFLISSVILFLSALFSCAVEAGAVLPYPNQSRFFVELPQSICFFALILAVICSMILWYKGSSFFRHFSMIFLLIVSGYIGFVLFSIPLIPDYASGVLSRIVSDVTLKLPTFSLRVIRSFCLCSGYCAVLMELISQEIHRRTEIAILSEKNRLSVESFENLRLQSDEIMMMHHDMNRHYLMLRSLAETSPENLSSYLDELIEQTRKIRPVAESGNQTLDIILNGKLAAAAEKGITTEILRCQAPEQLPLHDTELCCLFMNILDNAIRAASDSTLKHPRIRLDIHCKEDHFVFSCENSVSLSRKGKKSPIPGHGYGLKIIHQIMKRWGDMVSIEETGTSYKISVVIPLS